MLLLTDYCKLFKLLLFYSLHPTVFCMMNFHTWHLAVRCQLRTLNVYSLLTVIAFWQLLTVNCFRFTANCLLKVLVFITYCQLLTVRVYLLPTAYRSVYSLYCLLLTCLQPTVNCLLYTFTAYCQLLTVRVYTLLPSA